MLNIFNRNNRDRVEVPEIEVQGDEVEIQDHRPAPGTDEEPPMPPRRSYKLPKTKWFDRRN